MKNEKRFLIKAPIPGGEYYWMELGRGNTDDRYKARAYPEKLARELKDKEPLLELIPV